MSNIKKILVISLKAGGGHLKAAEALEKSLNYQYPQHLVKRIDMLDYASVLSQEFYGQWYLDLANKVPKFYQWLYENINRTTTDLRLLSDRLNDKRFKYFIEDFAPDLIICTHFVPTNLVTFWRHKYHHSYKVIVTLTDYEAHPLWFDPKVDLYTVATEDVKKQMIAYGARPDKIFVTGIPIDPKFSHRINHKKIRRHYGLRDQFTAAILAGGYGIGPIEATFQKIARLPTNFQIIVVTGKNKVLYSRIKNLSKKIKHHTLIIEFTDAIEEIMAIANVIISKPGGLTVSETLAVNTPLIIVNPIPGQEEANADYLIAHHAALRADTTDEIIKLLQIAIDYPCVISTLRRAVRQIAASDASLKIARIAKKFL